MICYHVNQRSCRKRRVAQMVFVLDSASDTRRLNPQTLGVTDGGFCLENWSSSWRATGFLLGSSNAEQSLAIW